MKRKVAEIILILLFYLIQVTFGNAIGIGGITPNLLIILPVLFGFFKGRNEGMLVGFLSGVMYDLFFSSLFGFSALVFVYIRGFGDIRRRVHGAAVLHPYSEAANWQSARILPRFDPTGAAVLPTSARAVDARAVPRGD